jgi:hypothetical protein
MDPSIQLKSAAPLITLTLLCFGLLPIAQAVSPAPDGGYPGQNTAEGQSALLHLAAGTYNTALGWASLGFNVTGNYNTGVGAGTLLLNTGDQNTATGAGALLSNTSGSDNTANGEFALFNNTIGIGNTANGVNALFQSTTGSSNTANGVFALENSTTGSSNIAVGFAAGVGVTTANNVICIGVDAPNVSNRCYIGQIYSNVQPIVGTNPDYVTINSGGRLGRANVSSRRYKHDIKPMDKASEAIYALKPVRFRYHKQYDATQTIAFGLIAEEVAEVYPDLVGRNPMGEPESVRYEQINAMLLNEFLKEHRKVEDLKKDFQATIAQQQKEISALAATVKEQAAQIQKVSAQLEASKPAPQVVNNP